MYSHQSLEYKLAVFLSVFSLQSLYHCSMRELSEKLGQMQELPISIDQNLVDIVLPRTNSVISHIFTSFFFCKFHIIYRIALGPPSYITHKESKCSLSEWLFFLCDPTPLRCLIHSSFNLHLFRVPFSSPVTLFLITSCHSPLLQLLTSIASCSWCANLFNLDS